ncbi:hypothetical protein HG536_0H02850 [Torulaspora globosa]|uniref:Uncharacterized protein n=1 Tax=Torulaspora globosa TaxID=48254 RepID=A0A7G3ZN24_9SACH|nr:uncharacterized protein HG536_0H02850 [Torulaspora globosa]QLL34910.1 hypothetical protein HG536_0H02850 [Torulaspora globosa]
MVAMPGLDTVWTIAKVLFRVYQWTCYFFVFILLLPVITLYFFDLVLYLCRLVSFSCRWQAYHIKNHSGLSVSFISGRNGRILNSEPVGAEEEVPKSSTSAGDGEGCGSSGVSILSGCDSGSEHSLSDTPYSPNYCLTSLPHDFHARKGASSRRSTIAGSGDRLKCASLVPEHLGELIRANPQFTELRRTKSSEIALH